MKRDIYQTITDRFVEQLKKGTVPWQKPWFGVQNMVSRKQYRGINALLLGSAEFQSPFWVSFKQALDLGGHIKKGEKSTPVLYYKLFDRHDEAGNAIIRGVDNAFSRFEILLGRAQNKRKVLNRQIARLNTQLKNAQDDAEVQKLVGSLSTAQTALNDLDDMVDTALGQVESLHMLNQKRKEAEEVAADEISRERNRELARLSAEAEAELPDFTEDNTDVPPPPPVPQSSSESNSVSNPDNPAMTAHQTASNTFAVVDNDRGTVSHHKGSIATPHTAQAAFNPHASKAQPLPPDSPLSTRKS
jgi:hypothetical protein